MLHFPPIKKKRNSFIKAEYVAIILVYNFYKYLFLYLTINSLYLEKLCNFLVHNSTSSHCLRKKEKIHYTPRKQSEPINRNWTIGQWAMSERITIGGWSWEIRANCQSTEC